MSDDSPHPDLTEQELEWVIGHLNEANERLERVMELTDTDLGDEHSDLAEAKARLNSYRMYVGNQVTKHTEDPKQ